MNDPRYIILTDTGAVATMGRIEPTADDVGAAFDAMRKQGCARAWLALASDSFHGRSKPTVRMIRELGVGDVAFADAVRRAGGK